MHYVRLIIQVSTKDSHLPKNASCTRQRTLGFEEKYSSSPGVDTEMAALIATHNLVDGHCSSVHRFRLSDLKNQTALLFQKTISKNYFRFLCWDKPGQQWPMCQWRRLRVYRRSKTEIVSTLADGSPLQLVDRRFCSGHSSSRSDPARCCTETLDCEKTSISKDCFWNERVLVYRTINNSSVSLLRSLNSGHLQYRVCI